MDYVKKIHKASFFVCILYFISSLVYTFPLILGMNDVLIGKGGLDGFQYIWNFYSFWYQISHFNSPFINQLIFYPVGANLLFSDYSAFTSLIGLPFINAPVFYMNLIIVGGLTLSAFFSYLLINKLTKNVLVSVLGGFIYGFSPTIGSFIETQHNYYLLASALLPLLFLVLVNFLEKPTKYGKRLVLLFWILFFSSYYFFILGVIMVSIFSTSLLVFDNHVRHSFLNKKNYKYFLQTFLFFLLTLLLVCGLIYTHAPDLKSWASSSSNYAASCNANLAGFITLSDQNFLFGQTIGAPMYQLFSFIKNGDTPFYYLGIFFLTTLLIGVYFIRKEKYVLSLYLTGVMVFLFSLGLVVRFGRIEILNERYVPFYYLSKVPLLGMIDCPIRFVGGVHLVIAVLFSIVVAYVLKRWKKLGVLLVLIGVTSLIIDYNVAGFSFVSVFTPKVYTSIASIDDNKTVLELPSGLAESKGAFGYDWPSEGLHTRQLYWQTIYKKPRVGGYISRIPTTTYDYFKTKPIISDLFTLTGLDGEWSGKEFSIEEKNAFIQDFNLGYIIVEPETRQAEFILAIEQVLEGTSYEKLEIDNYVLYRIIH